MVMSREQLYLIEFGLDWAKHVGADLAHIDDSVQHVDVELEPLGRVGRNRGNCKADEVSSGLRREL